MIKKSVLFCFVSISLLGLIALSVFSVRAQENEPLPPEFPPAAGLKKQYVTLLTQYRTDEQTFKIAKQENVQTPTLGNLEVAVKAFKDVQLTRNETIIAYLQTLLSTVSETKGMEIEKKQAIIIKLQTMIAEYQTHGNEISDAQDKVGLSATATTFTKKQDAFQSLAYESLALLKITLMQSAVDQLRVATDLVQKQVGSKNLSATAMAEKQRGFDELGRTIDSVRDSIAKANEYHDRVAKQDSYSESGYNQVRDMLNVGYPKLRQAESFLLELATK